VNGKCTPGPVFVQKVIFMASSQLNPSSSKRNSRKHRRDRIAPVVIEPLDPRVMLAVTASFSAAAGELRVTGDDQDNVIVVSRNAAGAILVNNGAVAIQGDVPTIANTTHFHIVGAGGNDAISLDETNGPLPGAAIFGGAGNDTLTGGSGEDFIEGDAGNDVARMGAGNDTFSWNPGDGSDIVDGQDGKDNLIFNGSDLAEQFHISDSGIADSGAGAPFHRVRLTRDLGNVTMDLGTVEGIGLNPLGGADTITIDDQSATDLRGVGLDLEAGGTGTGDGQPDAVILNGTNGDDSGQVSSTAFGDPIISAKAGLLPFVSIIGADPTQDTLTLNSLDGADTIDASGLAPNLIGLVLNGGAGNDFIVASPGDDLVNGGPGNNEVQLGAGNDTFTWNPGDGSSLIDAGDGIDSILVNGSDQAESFTGNSERSIGGNGGLGVLLKGISPTPFNLQIQNAEHLTLNANGGDDSFTGADDFAQDIAFTMNGGDGNDTLRFVGTPGDDTAELSAQGAIFNNALIALSNVEAFQFPGGSGGNDSLNVVSGAWHVNADTPPGTMPNVTVTVGAGAVVTFDTGQHLAGLTINGGLVNSAAAVGNTLAVGPLAINGGGRLNLGATDLLTTTDVATIRGLLVSARTPNGDWTGPGITSNIVAANPAKFTIGFAHGGDASNPIATLGAGMTLVRPTLAGDANLDGTVDFFDLVQILATRFNAGGTTASYTDGDLDFDGKVDFFDLTVVLSGNFGTGQTFAGAAAAAATPGAPSLSSLFSTIAIRPHSSKRSFTDQTD
jgi:Ca2+-binding RTX toxin-like protein